MSGPSRRRFPPKCPGLSGPASTLRWSWVPWRCWGWCWVFCWWPDRVSRAGQRLHSTVRAVSDRPGFFQPAKRLEYILAQCGEFQRHDREILIELLRAIFRFRLVGLLDQHILELQPFQRQILVKRLKFEDV